MVARPRSLRSRLPLIGGLLFMALFTAAVIWGVMGFIKDGGEPERPRIQTISLVRPPPPKPPEEKPPEPQKINPPKDEVKIDQPQPPQPQAPPPPPGGIPDGPSGGMATDLAPGSGVGIGGGGNGDGRRGWYSNQISRQLEADLRRAKRLQGRDYRVVAQLWFNAAGAVSKVQLDQGTGDSELDAALRTEIMQVSLHDPLPDDIPQPVRLRVVSR
jgi:protein TonB